MQFIWTSFGIMAPPRADNRYIYAANEQGDARKMIKIKYREGGIVAQKCAFLVGYPTIIRTSQNSSIPNQRTWIGSSSLPTPSPLHTSCIEVGSTF